MSSDKANLLSGDFTIPKKIPKKQRDVTPVSKSSPLPLSRERVFVDSVSLLSQPTTSLIHRHPRMRKKRSFDGSDSRNFRDSSPSLNASESVSPQATSTYSNSISSTYIQIKSLQPLVVKVKVDGIPLNNRGILSTTHGIIKSNSYSSTSHTVTHSIDTISRQNETLRSSNRKPKRNSRVDPEEFDDKDSDDFMSSGEEEEAEKRRIKRAASKKKLKMSESLEEDQEEGEIGEDDSGNILALPSQGDIPGSVFDIGIPPSGELNCLWYSREPFLHVFVIEKILAWKTRSVTTLELCESIEEKQELMPTDNEPVAVASSSKKNVYRLDFEEATKLKEKAIFDTGNDFRKRMDISRINPCSCPYVQKLAAQQEFFKSRRDSSTPKFRVVVSNQEREEIYLIKWRGRSHLHCSWERKRDLEKFDHSTQLGAARGKINRFIQNQVMTLGNDWKKVLEDGRKAASTPTGHSHHLHTNSTVTGSNETSKEENSDEEEYFSPMYLEVERILGCDESEVEMNVLARQRALNIRNEREALKKRELDDAAEEKWLKGERDGTDEEELPYVNGDSLDNIEQMEKDGIWDPEDNVRYIVRWKGLHLTEATWEYWIDIKRDFVDEVEDFWYRQKFPTADEIKEISKERHPHPKDFKKLTESPIFGVPSMVRPVASIEDSVEQECIADTDSGNVLRLRTYQLEGVNWLLWNWYNRRSCILADEMGLGKTIQSIGFLHELQRIKEIKVRGPFLVVAPLSLVSQWESETKEWAPDMNVVVYHGSADAREFLVKEEFYYTEQFTSKTTALSLKRKHITKFRVLITTYEVVLKDIPVLSKIHWKALIVDEAHRLKNIKSRLFEDLASVPRDFCLLLTGTPLQNSTEELWALLHFCDPVSFGSKDEFTAKFGQLTDASQVANLHTVLRPYLLRRVKEDVEKSLPPKEETIIEVTLTPIQKSFYKAIYEKNTSFLFKGAKPGNAPSLMNVMMELRKCCNHPFLIRGAEDRIIGDAATTERKALAASDDPKELNQPIDYARITGEQLVKSSGKFVLLSKLLPKLRDGGHKVLIFSQMVRVLDLLQELLQLKHYRYERLDGSTSASARNAAVDRFRRESFQRFVMLLSTRAGGLGLNLTAADTVIIFDSDWNPQNDLQAMARAHRIGQTRSVRVYRLLTAKTYEMHMFHSASLKLGLDRAVLAHQRQQSTSTTEETSSKRKSKSEREEQAKEIDKLLKKGAYDVFRDDDDNEAQRFMETDIDQLLQQSSRKVTYNESATSSLSSGLGSFSKASFVASTGDGEGKDVDLDDPDFWAKAVGLEAPPEEVDPNMMLIIDDGSKRSRKQVQVFDPHSVVTDAELKEKEKVAIKAQEEQERKDLIRLEKLLRIEVEREEKERKLKEDIELREKKEKELSAAKEEREKRMAQMKKEKEEKAEKAKVLKAERERAAKEVKIFYNERKTDRKRALKRAEHEDPVFERVKQAWDTNQRNRVVNAILRFGFGRFCKTRAESNFTSIAIQDIEVFSRSYIYQLGLQAASFLLTNLDCDKFIHDDYAVVLGETLRKALGTVVESGLDYDWICNAILAALCMHVRHKSYVALVRLPLALAEPEFVSFLGSGFGALRSLHRISFLARLNSVIEFALDRIIHVLGDDEMGRRGCPDCSTLDLDLKARHISIEELMHGLGQNLSSYDSNSVSSEYFFTCAPWWDRSCDIGLVVGTFIHGLGNYEAMRHDEDLPFINRIKYYVKECNRAEAESYRRFEQAAAAARSVFDTALDTVKRKFQEQTTAAVAAVVAANKGAVVDPKLAYVVQSQKLDDDDIITLSRLKEDTVKAFREPCNPMSNVAVTSDRVGKGPGGREILNPYCPLPLPDSKHLDHLLLQTVNCIQASNSFSEYSSSRVIYKINQCPDRALFAGCFSTVDKKRPQDNCSDYFLGAASSELASIAVGADSSRYERGPNVPLVLTRFGLGAILQADQSVVDLVAKNNSENGSILDNTVLSNESRQRAIVEKSDERGEEDFDDSFTSHTENKINLQAEFPIWQFIMDDTDLRTSLCSCILNNGNPLCSDEHFVQASPEFLNELKSYPCLAYILKKSNASFFSVKDALENVLERTSFEWPKKEESIEQYFHSILFPHCLKLCLLLSGEQAKITSCQGPILEGGISPIPDPIFPIECHSEEAMIHGYSILCRARLMKSIRFIVGGGVPFVLTRNFLRGPVLQQQSIGVPMWWCPWIHDLGVLVHAAFYGLKSAVTEFPVLQQPFIKQTIREVFIEGKHVAKPILPQSFLKNALDDEINIWIEMHSKQLPSPKIIEDRLAFLCSELTKGTVAQYDNLPIFHEGGWPSVDDAISNWNVGNTKKSGFSCLLVDLE